MKLIKIFLTILLFSLFLASCQLAKMGGDAKENPPDPRERVKKNLEQGKGFRLNDLMSKPKGGDFEFASSNELWKASLDIIDFIPLASVNYSGGIIITDWYSENQSNESIKINIRFLSNEIRSDSLSIKIYYKICDKNFNCAVSEKEGGLKKELMREILKKAAIYEKQNKDKNFKPYNDPSVDTTKP